MLPSSRPPIHAPARPALVCRSTPTSTATWAPASACRASLRSSGSRQARARSSRASRTSRAAATSRAWWPTSTRRRVERGGCGCALRSTAGAPLALALQAGTHRDEKGGLLPSAGRLPAFDALAAEFYGSATKQAVEKKAIAEAAALSKGALPFAPRTALSRPHPAPRCCWCLQRTRTRLPCTSAS